MSEQASRVLEQDDGVSRAEDAFRRATFNWAFSTKKMVESAKALGANTRVVHAALVDIEYARDLLNGLRLPEVKKSALPEGEKFITAPEVRECVSSLAARVIRSSVDPEEAPQHQAPEPVQSRRGVDFSAPVHPKGGKMLWAGVDCPMCPSRAGQRCRKDDGTFQEKPHPQRKSIAEGN